MAGFIEIDCTAEEAGRIAAALPAEIVATLTFEAGVLIVPEEHQAAVEAVDSGDIVPELLAYASDKRWRIEVGGIVLGGVPIATDDRSKIMIMGARVAAAANPDWETVWHGSDGQTYPLNAASMIAISNAVEAHVNATFAAFAIVKVDIEAGAITTVAEIDAAFA